MLIKVCGLHDVGGPLAVGLLMQGGDSHHDGFPFLRIRSGMMRLDLEDIRSTYLQPRHARYLCLRLSPCSLSVHWEKTAFDEM